jgi:short-subunit dehydrogenase
MSFLSNKTVWITGASSGIGKALAIYAWNHGAQLILSSRRRDVLEQVRQELGGDTTRIHIVPLDLANYSALAQQLQQRLPELPPVDIMIHNGGISQRASAEETALEVTERIMATNFFGAVALTKVLLPMMRNRKSGAFVVISSVAGKLGTPLRSSYAASKHALHGYFDSLRAEMVDSNISVLMVCPGYIKTNISKNAVTGDGTPHNVMDENQEKGLDAACLAERIFSALEKGKNELYVGGKEVIGIYLKRFFPAILERIVAKSGVPK